MLLELSDAMRRQDGQRSGRRVGLGASRSRKSMAQAACEYCTGESGSCISESMFATTCARSGSGVPRQQLGAAVRQAGSQRRALGAPAA